MRNCGYVTDDKDKNGRKGRVRKERNYFKKTSKFALMRTLLAILLPLTVTLFACCPAQEGSSRRDYDSSIDCLNGTLIVSLEGKYGLVDTSGKEILPPVYDELYFLTDEIAAAFSGQDCGFFDRSGRRLAQTRAAGTLSPSELLDSYNALRDECRLAWDNILGKYARMHEYCRSGEASAAEAELMAEEIRKALRTVGGPMEKDQRAAFEAEYSDYR